MLFISYLKLLKINSHDIHHRRKCKIICLETVLCMDLSLQLVDIGTLNHHYIQQEKHHHITPHRLDGYKE
jgi:hypothetical protein